MKKTKIFFVILIFIILLFLLTNIYLFLLSPLDTGVNLPKNFGDAILVLGGGLQKGNKIGYSTKERLDQAIKLYRTKRRKIIVSDGSLYLHSPAIKIIKDFLISMNIKNEDIVFEGKSQTTFENLINTRNLIRNLKLKKIIVCTSPYHQLRTEVMMKYLNLKNYKIVKMYNSEIFNPEGIIQRSRNIRLIFREYLSLIKFKIFKR